MSGFFAMLSQLRRPANSLYQMKWEDEKRQLRQTTDNETISFIITPESQTSGYNKPNFPANTRLSQSLSPNCHRSLLCSVALHQLR
jgi:hypothetical protein